jgi:hypothetical protein
MNSSRGDLPAGDWDKVVIMGKQIAPDDKLFSTQWRAPGPWTSTCRTAAPVSIWTSRQV